MTSLISSVLWVPRGVSARNPRKYDLTDPEEVARVEKLGRIKLDDARRDLEELERLEKDVDGMYVDEDDEGDWEDEGAVSEQDDNEKTGAGIKQISKDGLSDLEGDVMKQYNLDDYDAEVSRSAGGYATLIETASKFTHFAKIAKSNGSLWQHQGVIILLE